MEQLFGAFSGGEMDMNQIMGQMQKMFAPHEGSVNFDLAKDVAGHTVAAAGADPSPNSAQQGAVDDAAQLAESWLDTVTLFPVGRDHRDGLEQAEWIEATRTPGSSSSSRSLRTSSRRWARRCPRRPRPMAGPLLGMLRRPAARCSASRSARPWAASPARSCRRPTSASRSAPSGIAAVLPSSIEAFGEGLSTRPPTSSSTSSLRECAHHRLFHHVPWLRPALVGAIEDFGRAPAST